MTPASIRVWQEIEPAKSRRTMSSKSKVSICASSFTQLCLVPPHINSESAEFKVVENGSLVMPCDTSGIPTPQITWTTGGRAFTTDINAPIYTTGDGKHLKIGLAKPEHAGFYTCK
jgi:hypothetical protein